MTHSLYTQNILIKNPNELVKNAYIECKDGLLDSISSLNDKNTLNDLGFKYIISPGFINLHCHSAYQNLNLSSNKLFPWIKDLLIEQNQDSFDALTASRKCYKEAMNTGTTFMVDNTSFPEASMKALGDSSGFRAIIASELFGSNSKLAEEICKTVVKRNQSALEEIPDELERILNLAFSPHSLYSVSPEIWGAIYGELANADQFASVIFSHFAEDIQEEYWFQDRDSSKIQDLEEFWQGIGLWGEKQKFWKQADSSWDYFKKYILDDFLKSGAKMVLTHAINLSEQEISEIAEYESIRLVTCPRSNDFLKHNMARVDLWEKHGVLYGLGTDSKASNYDMDMRKEALALKANFKKLGSDISYKRLFELLTIDAARVLDMDKQIGSLELGKSADYCIWKLKDQSVDLDALYEQGSESMYEFFLSSDELALV